MNKQYWTNIIYEVQNGYISCKSCVDIIIKKLNESKDEVNRITNMIHGNCLYCNYKGCKTCKHNDTNTVILKKKKLKDNWELKNE